MLEITNNKSIKLVKKEINSVKDRRRLKKSNRLIKLATVSQKPNKLVIVRGEKSEITTLSLCHALFLSNVFDLNYFSLSFLIRSIESNVISRNYIIHLKIKL